VTSLAIMGLHRSNEGKKGGGTGITGQIRLDGEDLVSASAERVRQLRGSKMAMIFQDPLSALHPYYSVGDQISEAYRVHNKVSKQVARKRTVDLLGRVGIPQPSVRVDDFPHQFSGGMRQRAMIAMALSCDPELLIADEPTTALDVTVQAQILDLIVDLQAEFGSAVIIITHDLGVVAEVADDVLVMYAGRMAEKGSGNDVFRAPGHPYTWGLLGSMPRLDVARVDRLRPIRGTPPSLINVPSGCPFHPRCGYPSQVGGDRCTTEIPVLRETGPDHQVACHLMLAKQQEIWAQLAPGSATAEAAAQAETAAAEAAASAEPGEGVTEVPGEGVTEVEAT